MSQTLRQFIREAALIKESDKRSHLRSREAASVMSESWIEDWLTPTTSASGYPRPSIGQQVSDTIKGDFKKVKDFIAKAPDNVVTYFSSGFTDAQKRGEGEGSILGSKVSVTKMGAPLFVVLCKINYKGKDYMIAKRYSEALKPEVNLIPNYGNYLDPNVLLHGKIIGLPQLPTKDYSIERNFKRTETYSIPAPMPGHTYTPEEIAGLRKQMPKPGLGITNREVTYPEIQPETPEEKSAHEQDVQTQEFIKIRDTAVKAREWVENYIVPINNKDLEEIDGGLRDFYQITSATYLDFDSINVNSNEDKHSVVSTMKPENLYDHASLGIFEFNPSAKVYPPPYSYTVQGIADRIEGSCNFDATQYINTYWQWIIGEVSDQDAENLSICSNEIATNVVLDLLALGLSLAGVPGAAVALKSSVTVQSLALVQLFAYQVGKGDTPGAIITAARFVATFMPLIEMRTAYAVIAGLIQAVADITGSVSISGEADVAAVKKFFNNKGMSDDQKAADIPEFVNMENIDVAIKKLPEPLEERRIYISRFKRI